jgi:hypothetical protein
MKEINKTDTQKYLSIIKDLSKYGSSPNLSTTSRRLGYGGSTKPFRKYWDKLVEKHVIIKPKGIFKLSDKHDWTRIIQTEGFSDFLEDKKITNVQLKYMTEEQLNSAILFMKKIEEEAYKKGFKEGMEYTLNNKKSKNKF